MTIAAAVTYLQTQVAALSGMRNAPAAPPDSTAVFPFAVSYISAFDVVKHTVGNTRYEYTITTEIHVARKDLPRDITALNVYPALFSAAVWSDPTFGGAVSTVQACTGSLVSSAWGGVDTLAWVCQTRVKIMG